MLKQALATQERREWGERVCVCVCGWAGVCTHPEVGSKGGMIVPVKTSITKVANWTKNAKTVGRGGTVEEREKKPL